MAKAVCNLVESLSAYIKCVLSVTCEEFYSKKIILLHADSFFIILINYTTEYIYTYIFLLLHIPYTYTNICAQHIPPDPRRRHLLQVQLHRHLSLR